MYKLSDISQGIYLLSLHENKYDTIICSVENTIQDGAI